ncbi:histone deacetylase 6-like isoform X1 [Pomacea canaliculata]|uniref:histone deacetylase 6-like isoform X1 n=1 Tax=Pomacea canaliculata TaxID=400727 RepID=UPI000D737B78|nr:histone deacetylase 6-like isoform X1 [Pomacea canaliculata]
MAEEFSGYCYFNNIAITTHIALKKYNLERILIVDWDVHHGQGTQFAFYDDPRVLFFSIHRFEHGEEWPHLRESDYDYIGQGKGKGFNVNVPLNEIGCDNSDYLAIMFNVLLPLAYEFQPQLVLVSAGYDSAVGCPEGQMTVTPACFAHFVNLLKTLAGGKIVLLLEGGYCVRTLAEASALSLRALLGDPTPNISPITGARKSVVESVLNVIKMHRAVHPSLAFQDTQQEGKEVGHSWQTYLPPEHNIQCRTKYNRPEQFPLMQECFDEVSDAVQQQINQQIEQLEQDTILSRPAHRTGFLYYQDLHQNGKNGSVWDKANTKELLSRCHVVPITHDDNKNSMEACVSSAIDAILENTVGSCILLPCGTYSEGTTQDLCYTFANALEACIHKNSQIKRTLVLNLAVGEDEPLLTSFAGTKSCMVVLSVGLSPVEKRAKDPSWRHIIQVPLTTSQMKNGDLISVGLQVLLPIAYEFAPDLVVFCLGSSEKKISQAEGQTDLTCMAHLLTMLNGLARGRMLLFVKPSAEVQEFGVVMDCISALLGDPLSILQPCLPQQSTVEVIKTLQDKYKSSWRTLQFREKLPSPRQTLEESV